MKSDTQLLLELAKSERALTVERDTLRAQLAAAKQHAEYQDKEIRQWANVCYVGTWPLSEEDTKNTGFYGRMAAKMTAERNAATARAEQAEAERNALAARVAELEAHVELQRVTLNTARAEVGWIIRNSEPVGIEFGDISTHRAAVACQTGLRVALARTPAQSLAKVQAAALREAAKDVREMAQEVERGRTTPCTWEACEQRLLDTAERLEAEASNNVDNSRV